MTPMHLLYVTDRAPETTAENHPSYGSDRSYSMAFGSVSIEIGQNVAWPVLVEESMESERKMPLDLRLGTTTELGRYPPLPYEFDPAPGGVTRDPAIVDAHEEAAASPSGRSSSAHCHCAAQRGRPLRARLRQHL